MRNTSLAAVAVLTLLAGCQSMMAPTYRSNVAAYGAQWFADAGHPLAGALACENQGDALTLVCSGTTAAGKMASMSGTLPNANNPGAPFVGAVAGKQVFTARMPQ